MYWFVFGQIGYCFGDIQEVCDVFGWRCIDDDCVIDWQFVFVEVYYCFFDFVGEQYVVQIGCDCCCEFDCVDMVYGLVCDIEVVKYVEVFQEGGFDVDC